LLRHPGGPCVGVDDWARHWVEVNQAYAGSRLESLRPEVTVRRWQGDSASSYIVFYWIEGGGHTWRSGMTAPRAGHADTGCARKNSLRRTRLRPSGERGTGRVRGNLISAHPSDRPASTSNDSP